MKKTDLEDKVERENNKKSRTLLPSLAVGIGIYVTSLGYHNDKDYLMLSGLVMLSVGAYGLVNIFYDIVKK